MPEPVQLSLFPERASLVRIRPERNEWRFYRLDGQQRQGNRADTRDIQRRGRKRDLAGHVEIAGAPHRAEQGGKIGCDYRHGAHQWHAA